MYLLKTFVLPSFGSCNSKLVKGYGYPSKVDPIGGTLKVQDAVSLNMPKLSPLTVTAISMKMKMDFTIIHVNSTNGK